MRKPESVYAEALAVSSLRGAVALLLTGGPNLNFILFWENISKA